MDDAYKVLAQGTTGALPYDHGFDRWAGVTHDEYSKAVEGVIRDLHRARGRALAADEAQELLECISQGRFPKHITSVVDAKNLERIRKWRGGFLKSLIVCERARELNPKLTKAELKAIAQAVVNAQRSRSLTPRAAALLKKRWIGGLFAKKALKTAAKKIALPLIIYSYGSAAVEGYAGEGNKGYTGVAGALDEMAREAACADLVEDTLYYGTEAAFKVLSSQRTMEEWQEDFNRKRFGDLWDER